MKKIKLTASLVAQFTAGSEVETIVEGGKLFLPVINLADIIGTDTTDDKKPTSVPTSSPIPTPATTPTEKVSSAVAEKNEVKTATAESPIGSLTEDEMMDMETSELLSILKKLGVDPNKTEGKNTNKKLRTLILENQSKKVEPSSDEEDSEDGATLQESTEEEEVDTSKEIAKCLTAFDEGKANKDKTIESIKALYEGFDDASTKVLKDLIAEFEGSEEEIETFAEHIRAVLEGDDEEESSDAEGGSDSEIPEGYEQVEKTDLEVGDEVKVWWDDEDNHCYYDGEVQSIKRGKVNVHYEDGTDAPLDENNTIILRKK